MVARWCLGYVPRVLLHAANLRHGTDNSTALPKEGVLRIFLIPFKNPTVSAGFEPANLCIRGQHATSAPPKPLSTSIIPLDNVSYRLKISAFGDSTNVTEILIIDNLSARC
jgi:hypothetical protein